MMRRALLLILILGVGVTGCATGQTILLDLRAAQPAAEKKAEKLKVAVTIFEDARPDNDQRQEKARIGFRLHLLGCVTYFQIKGGQLGPAVSRAVADSLTQRGLEAWVVKPGEQAEGKNPDLIVTGKILDLRAHASSRFGGTELVTRTKLALDLVNVSTQSSVHAILTGYGREKVILFDPGDLEQLLRQPFATSVQEFLAGESMAVVLTKAK
jgi:hypothetical protein